MEASSVDELRMRAATSASDATRADAAGDAPLAASKYDEAASALERLAEVAGLSEADKGTAMRKVTEYRSRAEQLRSVSLIAALPDVGGAAAAEASAHGAGGDSDAPAAAGPGGPPEQDDAPAPATGSGDEGKSTQDVAMKAAPAPGTIAYHIKRMAELDEQYQVSTRTAAAAKQLYEQARAVEEQYKLQEQMAAAAQRTYDNIKNAERDHHLSQRVVDGAKEAAERARRLEEEYKVTETLRDSAWNAFQRAKELEQQHQIQHRVAEAFQEGWEALRDQWQSAVDYDNEHNVSGKWQESLLASAETAKEYIQETIEYWRPANPAPPVSYPEFSANADV